MKKNIEWLKETLEERIETMAKFEDVSYSIGLKEAYQHTLLLINQLDEPEVLSQELPVIPEFVAEWYESEGKCAVGGIGFTSGVEMRVGLN